MSNEGTVTYELGDGVTWLGLNRPQTRNAIDNALLAELQTAVRQGQEEARALIIFGHGVCFSARNAPERVRDGRADEPEGVEGRHQSAEAINEDARGNKG